MATPLIKDSYNILGNSYCEIMSCVDIKDACHSTRLNPDLRNFVESYLILGVNITDMRYYLWV